MTESPIPPSLRDILSHYHRVAVAYSGGTDSAYLLAACADILGVERVLALTADSPLMPRAELAAARALARDLGVRHIVLPHDDLAVEGVVANPPDRCYQCKRARFERLLDVARGEGYPPLLHGENADDVGDYRPGSRAAEELGVGAPLRDAGLTKAQIRALSRARGLPTWDRPADACLASRFPYGTRLTREGLARVEAAEEALRAAWQVRQVRVRDHLPLARIEVAAADIARLAAPGPRQAAVDALRSLGYRYITLDLEGYRMGSLNMELKR
ncbi:MAG: ATP-dependent sacrificial sulfur transferase LarE [Anaerolineae bacterium]|nr:ATP-dependent sacrificial sulfur transferase LarE [Anaerolineae bacterium]